VAALLSALPEGTTTGTAHTKRYITTRSVYNTGKSTKLVAEELGGPDYISLNFYDLSSGPRLYPCEMPAQKVIDFLRSYQPDPR
jgi:hypothetical protein